MALQEVQNRVKSDFLGQQWRMSGSWDLDLLQFCMSCEHSVSDFPCQEFRELASYQKSGDSLQQIEGIPTVFARGAIAQRG